MNLTSEQFHGMIRRILKEEVDKENAIGGTSLRRVPEMNANGVDAEKKKGNKTFGSDANTRDKQSKEALVAELSKLVQGIIAEASVGWDDHDDLMINARDLKYIRISPRWEDSYVIEMMTRNEDRVWATGMSWEQVKEFVRTNLKEATKQPTAVEKAYDKSYRNREDQIPAPDKGLSQKDKPKTLPLTNEPPKETKNKDKNFTEKEVKKDADQPDQPMKEVGDFKKTAAYKVQDPVKLRKRKPDTKLTVKM